MNQEAKIWDAVIVGAGGAGMMCAATAAYRGQTVLLLDHAEKLGKKILISGGGRCNFTNIGARAECYYSSNPHFAKSALARYRPDDFLKLIEKHQVPFYEKKLGQLFCEDSAQRIVDLLVSECNEAGVNFRLNAHVNEITHDGTDFVIQLGTEQIRAKNIVLATGGLSVPKTGATDFGYKIARSFGHRITPLEPALVGFTMNEEFQKAFVELAGVSVDTIVSSGGRSFRENILFTHTGLSGPAILQASLFWKKGEEISINLVPDKNMEEFLLREKTHSQRKLANILSELWTARFAETLLNHWKMPDRLLKEFSDKSLRELAAQIQGWKLIPIDTAGFGRAEVTRGGVDADEINSKTMESKKQPGLYFVGELLDVTGMLGGYNFQWAWASGHAAGESI